jgi:hypothetical protein
MCASDMVDAFAIEDQPYCFEARPSKAHWLLGYPDVLRET